MGKKRIVKKGGSDGGRPRSRATTRIPKKKLDKGVLHIEATYNNTKLVLADVSGNAVVWSSSGSLGFNGARKSTPFAASKVGELIGEKAIAIGLKEAEVIIKGVGSGRESALRAFAGKGVTITRIMDRTPVPHNGPRPKKPRRV